MDMNFPQKTLTYDERLHRIAENEKVLRTIRLQISFLSQQLFGKKGFPFPQFNVIITMKPT